MAQSSNDMSMIYALPLTISHEEADSIFTSGDLKEICVTLVSLALNDADWKWVQQKCINHSNDPAPEVRGTAVTCLGHLARLHRELDVDVVAPIIQRLMHDPEVAGRAEDAWDDILVYLRHPPAP